MKPDVMNILFEGTHMARQLVTISRNFITTRLGGNLLAVDFDFIYDGADCTFKFVKGTPTSAGYTFGGTGPTWTTRVTEVSSNKVECEAPPNTCKKTITINVQIRETWSLTIPLIATFVIRTSRVIINRNLRYATQCMPACCQ